MIVLGIDPGPTHCGAVLYRAVGDEQGVIWASSRRSVADVLEDIRWKDGADVVAIERVQSYGISGASLLATAEVVGRLQQRALDSRRPESQVVLLYRREVLRALDVTGRGNRDSAVRQRLIEMHGGSRQVAVGRKAAPGPLYGVTGHAWQALGVAVAAAAMIADTLDTLYSEASP